MNTIIVVTIQVWSS